MFTWLLRDPQRVRVGIVNVQPSGHQCSSAVAWGKRDFKRLLKSALICPIHFQESIFMAYSLRQDLPMYTTGGRVNERKKQRKTHTHTHTRINVR